MKTRYTDISNVTQFIGNSVRHTREGGIAVRLINKTGVASVKGKIVNASTTTDNAVGLVEANDTDAIGVMYETGIADGQSLWVVVYGIVQVLLKDNTGSTQGYWVGCSDEAGYAYATESSPPAAPTHFREIGHCLQTVSETGSGTHVLCNMMLHFN